MKKATTENTGKKEKKKRSLGFRMARIFGIFLLSLLGLIILVLILIQTAPVQDFGRKKIVSYLQNKLKTRVEIKRLDIDFPKMLVLEGVYIEDKTKDTLIAGNQLKVDIDMFKLLKSEVQINEINLNGITLKVKRQLPDTVFNFQFIADAFASQDTTKKTDTSAMKMAIDKIIIDKTHLVYNDVVTGNDVDLYLNHFDTRIKTFDAVNLRYDVPSIVFNGVHGSVKQMKPIKVTAVVANPNPAAKNEAPKFLNFTNKEMLLKDFDLAYSNEVSAMSTHISLQKLAIHPESFDLKNSVVAIKDIELNNLNGFLRMDNVQKEKVVQLTTETGKEVPAEAMPFKVTIGAIRLNNNNFTYDDNTQPHMSSGMDYAHMDLKDLTLHADNFLMHNDTIATKIVEGRMKEKSGFVLNKFQTDVVYTNQGASLQNILIQTDGSEIKRTAVIRYPSLAAIQKNLNLIDLDIDIDNSYLSVKDILTFAPALAAQPAFRNLNSKLFVNTRVKGNMSRLAIDAFQFRGLGNINVDVAGVVNNAMDPNNVSADLNIRRFTATRGDIVSLAPKGAIPPNITIPENMSVTGRVKGGMREAFADLAVNTSLGSAKVTGNIANATDKARATYAANVAVNDLNVGAITQQPQNVGIITASFAVKGRGFDPDHANATVKGVVSSAQVMKYTYRNLRFDASMANQKFTADASIHDPNISLAINAQGSMGGNVPGFVVKANIDSIKTQPLHLTPDAILYHGNIAANFPEFNMDALNGDLLVTNSVLVMNGQRIAMDTVAIVAKHEMNEQVISMTADFVSATIRGQYKLEQLGDIMLDVIQPYYAIAPAGKHVNVDPYNFTMDAMVYDHPTLHAFVPDLKRFDSLTLRSTFSSSDGMQARLFSPAIVMGTNTIDGLLVNAATTNNALVVNANVNQLKSGTNVLYQTGVTANIANNKVDFGLVTKDAAARPKYKLAGVLSQEANNVMAISLKPDSLMLNYQPWSINSDNVIRVGSTLVNAHNFNLSKGTQQLSINSLNTSANSPMQVRFSSFELSTLTAFVQTDSTMINGTLNGNVELRDLLKTPNFVADLTVNNLSFRKDTIGDVNAKVNNTTANVFNTNVTITGKGNDVSLTGNYYLKPANNSNLDFLLNIRSLPMKTLESFSMGALNNTTGNLTGTVSIKGSATQPAIDGGISFNKVGFIPTALGTYFTIDGETIKVNNQGVHFDTFTIKDSTGNSLVIDGLMGTSNFVNYNFAMTVKARNFMAINTTKRQNSMYYGKFSFTTNLNISGTETSPVVDGRFRVNENTNLSIVIPQAEPGVVSREGVIEFVDMSAPGGDSLFKRTLAHYDSTFNKSALAGMDISINVEVVKEAVFNIIVDEANGDFLNLQGTAALTAGIDPSGKINMTGSYVVDKGGYELSFNFLKRRFDIQQGGKITWTGEPTSADLDITAVYVANTAPIDLVGNQITEVSQRGYYQQKLPFNVLLNVKGTIMQPDLSFDITLPKENNARVSNDILSTVNLRLDQLKTEPSELNKQVFALLLLNRFVGDNPFQSSGGGGGFNATALAKQSVSKILTEQLNNLTSDLIHGVDISFDVNSADDYTTGERRDRTDFDVAVSKRLLNDRLKVTVGNSFELEGPQQSNQQNASGLAGNISVDYNLSKDGSYAIRAYRKNDYEAIVEGYVIETGVKFIITRDYNHFREIFMKRKRKSDNTADKKKSSKDSTQDKATTLNELQQPEPDTLQNRQPASDKEDKRTVLVSDKVITDDKVRPVKDSTDEND